ncbi:MAG: DNA polymerase III subunit delta [Pseudomonadota bacterium]
MTALKAKDVDAFLKRPPAETTLVLFYGPDQGLVRERANTLARSIAPPDDPFNTVSLDEGEVKQEPARLADEAAALSFTGGRRVVRIRAGGEGGAIAGAVETFLKDAASGAMKSNALVVVEAGPLTKSSKLRKAAEGSKVAASAPCYEDAPADLRGLALKVMKEHGHAIDDDAVAYLAEALGEDRGVSRSELEKLALYARAEPGGRVTLADAKALLAGEAGLDAFEIAAAVFDGDASSVSRALVSTRQAGASPVTLLRALQRAAARLHRVQAAVADGRPPAEAMKSLRPPLFGPERDAFAGRRNRWPIDKLDIAERALSQAELDAKTTGSPQLEIVERVALRLARLAAR